MKALFNLHLADIGLPGTEELQSRVGEEAGASRDIACADYDVVYAADAIGMGGGKASYVLAVARSGRPFEGAEVGFEDQQRRLRPAAKQHGHFSGPEA